MKEKEAIGLLRRSGCSQEVIDHCVTVACYAREIAMDIRDQAEKKGTHISLDIDIIYTGGLLHDIGRSRTHGIFHAVEGARISRENGLDERLTGIIEHHIGAGITKDEAKVIGLPVKEYLPVTLEEKIVAHADNLVSGTNIVSLDEMVSKWRKKQLDEKIIRRIIELDHEICALLNSS